MFLEVVNDDSSQFDSYDVNLVRNASSSGLFSIALGDEICPETLETGFLGYISFSVKESLRVVCPIFIYPFGVFNNENDESFSGTDSWKNIFLRRRIASTIESLLLLRYSDYGISFNGLASAISNNRFHQLNALNWYENMSTQDAGLGALSKSMLGATVDKWPDWISENIKKQILLSEKS